jgi:transcription antitermination factor NusA-like protein
MTREQSLQIIRDAFSHVVVERIVVEYDSLVEEDVAKVFVSDDQLDAALGEDGFYPRGVAMKAGLAIEVVLADA